MMTSIEKILEVKPQIVRWKDFPSAKQAFQDWRTLMKEAAREPTTEKLLLMGDLTFLVWIYTSGEGVGGS